MSPFQFFFFFLLIVFPVFAEEVLVQLTQLGLLFIFFLIVFLVFAEELMVPVPGASLTCCSVNCVVC